MKHTDNTIHVSGGYDFMYRRVFDDGVFEIYKVFYKDGDSISHCVAKPCGKTPTELLVRYEQMHEQMREAFELPILTLTEEGTLEEEDLIEEGPRWYFPKKEVADATV